MVPTNQNVPNATLYLRLNGPKQTTVLKFCGKNNTLHISLNELMEPFQWLLMEAALGDNQTIMITVPLVLSGLVVNE